MVVDVCFSRRETCTQHWEITCRAGDKHGSHEMGSHFLTSNSACCGFIMPRPCSRFLGLSSFIWLVGRCVFWSEAIQGFTLGICTWSHFLYSLFTRPVPFSIAAGRTPPANSQVPNTSSRDCILRNLMALCWAAFTAVPGHLCVSVISSSNGTKCVRGFKKLMLVKCGPVVCGSQMLFLQHRPVSALTGALG